MNGFENLVQREIEQFNMIPAGAHVVAGVSGGADSVAMLLALHAYTEKYNHGKADEDKVKLTVVHVEHGVRGQESLEDAAYVEKLCSELSLECKTFHIQMIEEAKKRKMTDEEAGRACRYEIFHSLIGADEKGRIAVAHNMDDQAETVLMNLMRGSGMRGLAGMAPVRDRIIRPLLGVSRAMIETYLTEMGQAWRTDCTNLETDYTRNRVRLEIMPLLKEKVNAATPEHICKAASFVREAGEYIARETERAAEGCCRFEEGETVIDAGKLLLLDPVIRKNVLREAIERAGSGAGLKDVTADHIRDLEALASKQSGRRICLPGMLRAFRTGRDLVISFRNEEKRVIENVTEIRESGNYRFAGMTFEAEIIVNSEKTKVYDENTRGLQQALTEEKTYTKWLNYDNIQSVLCLRTRRTGDYIAVNADGGRKKLKDYMIDQKIPAAQRDSIVLVADGSRVLWVVGYRIGEDAKIKEDTQKMIRVTLTDHRERMDRE